MKFPTVDKNKKYYFDKREGERARAREREREKGRGK